MNSNGLGVDHEGTPLRSVNQQQEPEPKGESTTPNSGLGAQEGNTARDASVRGTMESRVAEIRARLAGTTAGPWLVWDGIGYMGGGRDLCIGAGPTWMANMDHRACGRRPEHEQAWAACGPEADADVCSLSDEFTAEQEANAHFIARAREDVPFLLAMIDYLDKQVEEEQNENFRLRHGDEMAAHCGVPTSVVLAVDPAKRSEADSWSTPAAAVPEPR